MAILAGHPQYVFYMGVAAAVYAVLNMRRAAHRGKMAAGLIAIVAGGICLAAIQLFTGVDEGRESLRSLGLPYRFAASFSFPPEDLLTLLAPRCFGDGVKSVYFGRWFVTDGSLFVSVAGLALAVCGTARGARENRRFSITMLLVSLALALGSYTPLFHVLYNFVPGFNLFRGMDKFLWLAALFLSMLAAVGLDALLRGQVAPCGLIAGAVCAGLVLVALSCLPRQTEWWGDVVNKLLESTMRIPPMTDYAGPDFASRAGMQFTRSLIKGTVCLFLAAGLLALVPKRPRTACAGLVLMAAIELGYFAGISLLTFNIGEPYSPGITKLLAQHPGDYRIASTIPTAP